MVDTGARVWCNPAPAPLTAATLARAMRPPIVWRRRGEVPERSNGAVSKTVVLATVPRVRIPPSPPSGTKPQGFPEIQAQQRLLRPRLGYIGGLQSGNEEGACLVHDVQRTRLLSPETGPQRPGAGLPATADQARPATRTTPRPSTGCPSRRPSGSVFSRSAIRSVARPPRGSGEFRMSVVSAMV